MIPIGTDAPIYHWPIATVGLIATTIAVSVFAWIAGEEATAPWMLVYGDGLHPLQWVSSNFLHAGVMHLVGNMIFLWTFGLIVEGKVGALAFLAIYLGLGVLEGALVQAAMLGVETHQAALGASGAICGLIGVGIVWAPRNEVSVLLIYFFGFMLRVRQFDWPVIGFAALYFAWQIFNGVFSLLMMAGSGRFVIATEGLHLIGAVLGFALGTLLLKMELVDCEGWDLYTRGLSGRAPIERTRGKSKRRKTPRREPRSVETESADALANLRAALDEGAALEALASYQYLSRMSSGWRPLEPDLLRLIALLQREGHTPESLPVMKDYVTRYPEKSARIRLKLAQILLRDQHRPTAALRILAEVDDASLPEDLRSIRRRMEQEARRQQEEGELEVEGDVW